MYTDRKEVDSGALAMACVIVSSCCKKPSELHSKQHEHSFSLTNFQVSWVNNFTFHVRWVVLCVSQPILMVMAERMVVAQLAKQAHDLHQVC